MKKNNDFKNANSLLDQVVGGGVSANQLVFTGENAVQEASLSKGLCFCTCTCGYYIGTGTGTGTIYAQETLY